MNSPNYLEPRGRVAEIPAPIWLGRDEWQQASGFTGVPVESRPGRM